MQAPPPAVPFVEYVLKAMEHPPFMFVSKLAACCTILFLTRSDPELLRALSFKWAVRFQQDRKKLISIIRRRSKVSKAAETETEAALEKEVGGGGGGGLCSCGRRDAREAEGRSQEDEDAEGNALGECDGGIGLCNPDDAVEHLLKILNSLVPMYFSWNWHRTDYVIQINKEYEAYVRESILPVCVTTSAEDGLDDEEETPWLLSPSEYLSSDLLSVGSFYSPVTHAEPGTSDAARRADEAAHSAECTAGEEGGEESNPSTLLAEELSTRTSSNDEDVRSSEEPTEAFSTSEFPLSSDKALLSFVTLANFREALEANTKGLVIIFHAKYSYKSNEVLEVFQQIVQRRLLDPMPDIAVIYTVAEPELASLYNISWFPTIIYTPPPLPSAKEKRRQQQQQRHYDANRDEPRDSCELEGQRKLPAMTPRADGSPPTPSRQGSSRFAAGAKQTTGEASLPSGSTEEMGCSADGGAAAAASGRMGGGGALSSLPRPANAMATKNRTAPSVFKAGGGGGGATPVSLPVVPSPTQVLYGFAVDREKHRGEACGSPQLYPLTLMGASPVSSSVPGGNPVESSNLCVPSRSDSSMSGNLNGSGHCHRLSHHVANNSPTSLSFSALVEDREATVADTLHECIANDGHVTFPINGVVSVASLVAWVASKGRVPPRVKAARGLVTCVSALRAELKYKKFRELHSAVVMLRRLQSGDGRESGYPQQQQQQQQQLSGSGPAVYDVSPRRAAGGRPSRSIDSLSSTPDSRKAASHSMNEPPLFVFLGGGMAAGKSTAATAVAQSSWWRNHKDQSVVVNADEFKVTEPVFDGLQAESHQKSTRAAEALLVQAINQGRSIVFDSTMMWAPFVRQVIDMVRNAHTHLYGQGRGYRGPGKPEEYFLRSKARPTPLPYPYVIRFLGITVEPETAVPRGFLRKFSTGRGVPITAQLRSFRSFAENFALYTSLVDSTTLYNNNVFVDLEKGELPPIIAEQDSERTNGEFKVFDEAAYQLFLKQTTLNEDADNILELYPTSSPV